MTRFRAITDPQGRTWHVRSVFPSTIHHTPACMPPDYRAGWLAFESGEMKRRLAPIPPGWDLAPDDVLRALLENATEARRSTPSVGSKALGSA